MLQQAKIAIIVILFFNLILCNASTLGLYNRDGSFHSRSRGVQHWIFPNSKESNNFSLNKFGLGVFNTLLGQGNPFAQPESDINSTQSSSQRIVDGVINALGRK